MQLIQANHRAAARELRVDNQADSATIFLYGIIDEYFGVSAEQLAKELEALKGKAVTLRINSPGGDVFDGRAMYAAIKQHGNVTAQIDGLAASAATYVAMAAKTVTIVDGGFMMIHNAWTLAFGNKNDLTELAALLDKFDESIINDYSKRTGKDHAELAAMMDAETWLNANEAKDMGFVDSIFDGDVAADASAPSNAWDLSAFDNAPKALTDPKKEPPDDAWMRKRALAEKRLRILTACSN